MWPIERNQERRYNLEGDRRSGNRKEYDGDRIRPRWYVMCMLHLEKSWGRDDRSDWEGGYV